MEEDFAWPSRDLLNHWREWIELHAVLDKGMPGVIAAPFFSAVSSQASANRILVVGKATAKEYWLAEYKRRRKSPDDAIRERLRLNRQFVRDGGSSSAFWKMFRQLTNLFPEPNSHNCIWSNVAKIGCRKGNPNGILLSAQKDLAKRTLKAEIKEYQPVLIVFTTGGYADDVISDAIGHDGWQQSKKSDPDDELWWRESAPAMLVTRHPQGVAKDKIDFWIKKAATLVESKASSSR